MLCLNKGAIENAAAPSEIIGTVEKAMRIQEGGSYNMPDRMHAEYEGNTLLLMPCFVGGYFGTKLVSLFPGNAERELPVLYGTMILNDGDTGDPLALLEGSLLNAMRTGAVGAAGIRHTAPEDVRTLGVVGAGVQGFYQALYACEARPFAEVRVFDAAPEKADAVVARLVERAPGVRFTRSDTVEDLLADSQVVITATGSTNPVLPEDAALLENRHFVGIGSYKPEMREFPETLFRMLDAVFVDTAHAMKESGDLVQPLENGWIGPEQVKPLGALIVGDKDAAIDRGRTTLFKSVGMALFDVLVGTLIYTRAQEKGLGLEFALS
jgi:ornithine cyclodeaminase